ncbi:hypothetical protein VOLCADRAFT_107109 [Volvox carteri f. nagariensis]|uniref:Crinkler (CRN) family protein n=1 Tax=Volvox carteri f. nagariensis TaxID=3068 RepID=D8UC01_VOLCA|nr:uncharacterized protein VOLCADRAFT_107109 [Volvox carteri f. nagariensis]EFJ42709.1 hypothetical protein VOLCADRAFT_107109 [Volvox carteri f. nagariensis]|eukprot:XP_002956170.1 hypothetical protein VOLCADRAFT_107109 [Volvox carteri f. nagariensis]
MRPPCCLVWARVLSLAHTASIQGATGPTSAYITVLCSFLRWAHSRAPHRDVYGFCLFPAAFQRHSAAISVEEKATRFIATLCTLAVPGAGDLLTVGSGDVSFPLHGGSRQLYVRKCYPNLFTVIYASENRKHVVTGTPGIGKSYFFYYMLMRLLESPSPPPFILWQHHSNPGKLWCYTHETGVVWSGARPMAFGNELHNRDSWWVLLVQHSTLIHHTFILPCGVLEGLGAVCCGSVISYVVSLVYPEPLQCLSGLCVVPFLWLVTYPLDQPRGDGVQPDTSTAAHTVLLTSPVHATMKEMDKEGANVLYMPLWELEELLDCRRCWVWGEWGGGLAHVPKRPKPPQYAPSKMYDMVPEVTVKDLFGYYGGMARYVLQHPSLDPDQELLELLRSLHTAINTCKVKQVRMAIGAVEMVPEASHPLLHIVANDAFKKQRLRFASNWAAGEFVKRALEFEKKKVISLLKTSNGGLNGMLYEPVMHAVLAAGGKFDVVPLDRETLERGNEEKLDIQPCKTVCWFKDNISSVTVSESKEINAADLEKKLAQLGIPDNPKPSCSLFFVVSPDVYNTFKVRAATKKRKAGKDGEAAWPPGTGEKYPRSVNTRLYILRGNYQDLHSST